MEIGSILQTASYDKYLPSQNSDSFKLPFMQDDEWLSSFFQSGRNAIEVLFAETAPGASVLVPDFVCGTVPEAIQRAGCRVVNYHIDDDFTFSFEEINALLSETKILYIVHFFGRKFSETEMKAISHWKNEGITVVEDITMSLYSKDPEAFGFGDYIIGSIRKWLPVSDGGFILSKAKSFDAPKMQSVSLYSYYYQLAQMLKKQYIEAGEKDAKLKETYMNFYHESIRYLFSDYSIAPISPVSMNYILNTQSQNSYFKRVQNYTYLSEGLKDFGDSIRPAVILNPGYVPFGMVVKCTKRDELLQYLIKNDIYCNIHWRLDLPAVFSLSNQILTIPCDERYGKKEMDRILQVIKDFYR
ncbi:MAG: DegT/DnrJ/EryC1/StrS family aminotransferase [Lachnospiraceae bacterium]|nr:DegT/DnrJ/EryC1/StrS family aminotransferase [Lachnospiraceae bacterium]